VFESRPEWAETMDINPDFVSAIFKLIHDESIRIQTERKEDF
jgi:chorismate mutase